jgi:replicative DNA helicase
VENERAALGAILVGGPNVLKTYLSEVGLRPEHFADAFNASVFKAAVDISDEGHKPDVLTISTKLKVPSIQVDALAAETPDISNIRAYAEAVVEGHRWRLVGQAGSMLQLASERRETALESKAMELLAAPVAEDQRTLTPEQLADLKFKSLNEGKTEAFPLPFFPLNTYTSGGVRRGEMTLIGGWSSHGKSIFIDQTLIHMARAGLRCHLYINEMSPQQRVDRWLAGATGVPFYKLRSGDLGPEELAKVVEGLNHLPFGITDVAGWSAKDIARHITWNKWDVCGVDILHLIEHNEEKDIRNISRTLNQATKPSQGNCAILATVHLNENRAGHSAKRPRPSLGDIRGTGMLKNDADLVMFVHREQDVNGVPELSGEGKVYIAKGRNASLGGLDVRFDPRAMTFSEKIS